MKTDWRFHAKITGLIAFVENPLIPRMRALLVDTRGLGPGEHVPRVTFNNKFVVRDSWIAPPESGIEGDPFSGLGMSVWNLEEIDLEFLLLPGIAPVDGFRPIREAQPSGNVPTPGVDNQDMFWMADLRRIHEPASEVKDECLAPNPGSGSDLVARLALTQGAFGVSGFGDFPEVQVWDFVNHDDLERRIDYKQAFGVEFFSEFMVRAGTVTLAGRRFGEEKVFGFEFSPPEGEEEVRITIENLPKSLVEVLEPRGPFDVDKDFLHYYRLSKNPPTPVDTFVPVLPKDEDGTRGGGGNCVGGGMKPSSLA